MEHQKYYHVTASDSDQKNRINLSTMELKVIYNHFLEVVEDYPDMMTYKSVLDKVKNKLDTDCLGCEYYYGVNDILNMEWHFRDDVDEVVLATELNVQGTENSSPEDMVLVFSQDQIETMYKVNKRLGKNIRKRK